MRYLGLDVGTATIGVAVSDPLGITAQGLCTIRRETRKKDLAALRELVVEYQAEGFVLGLPLNLNGTRGEAVERAEAFGRRLTAEFGLPVYFQDERLTTVAAHRALLEADTSRSRRRDVVDKLAAVLILAAWLDERNAPAPNDGADTNGTDTDRADTDGTDTIETKNY